MAGRVTRRARLWADPPLPSHCTKGLGWWLGLEFILVASNKASAYLTGCPRLTSFLSVPASSQHPKGTRQRRDRHPERGSPHVLMGRGQAVVVQWGWPGWHQFLISSRHGGTSPRERDGGPPALQTGPPLQTLRCHPPCV